MQSINGVLSDDRLAEYLKWNSYYSPRYSLLYVSTPKVACTSLKWWLASLEGHTRAIQAAKGSPESDSDLAIHHVFWKVAPDVTGLPDDSISEVLRSESVFRFGVVRNPYKRVFSAWQSKLVLREPLQAVPYRHLPFFNRPLETWEDISASFEGFLQHLTLNEAPHYWDHHWRSQEAILRPDLIEYDIISQLENTEELTSALLLRTGKGVPSPFATRRANESLIPYQREFLTPTSVRLIQELYAGDFERFEYSTEPPTSREGFSREQLDVALLAVAALRKRHQQLGERAEVIDELRMNVQQRDAHIGHLAEEKVALSSGIERAGNELLASRDEINALNIHLHHVVTSKDTEIAALGDTCAALQSDLQHHESENVDLHGKVAELSKTKGAEIAALQDTLATQQRHLESLKSENTGLHGQLVDLAAAKDNQIDVLQQVCAKHQAESQAYQSKNATLQTQLTELFMSRFQARPTSRASALSRFFGASARRPSRADLATIRGSGLFDATFYLTRNPDVAAANVDPVVHYLSHGWREGRDPSVHFSTIGYLAAYPDVAAKELNPLLHYYKYGREERRGTGGVSAQHDLENAADVRIIGESNLFDAEFYLAHNPDVVAAKIDPVIHYVTSGWHEGRDPSARFKTTRYLAENPDVSVAGINPLAHYIRFGQSEGRALASDQIVGGAPSIETFAPRSPPSNDRPEKDIREEISAIEASGLFDEGFYVSMYPELNIEPGTAVEHYCRQGWLEGRNPSDDFDTKFYLEKYADIRNGSVNPFFHYVVAGTTESRLPRQETAGHYEDDTRFGSIETDIKLLAFYVTPKWEAVQRARPKFPGHIQPVKPLQDGSYFGVSDAETLRKQVSIAKAHGLYGYCFEVPSTRTKRRASAPVTTLMKHRDIDINFAVIQPVDASIDLGEVAAALSRYFLDRRYVHVGSRPLLIVDLPSDYISCLDTISAISERISKHTAVKPFILARPLTTEPHKAMTESLAHVCDGVLDSPLRPKNGGAGGFATKTRGSVATVPYNIAAQNGMSRAQSASISDYPMFPCVSLPKDDSGEDVERPVVHTGFDPQTYRRWLDAAFAAARNAHARDRRFVFIDSWNNWSGGTYLEASDTQGFLRLNETTRALTGLASQQFMPKVTVIVPNYNHEKYLRKRLTSIYEQSYTNIEVILMDDKSSDRSREVLDEYHEMYPDLTRKLYNEKNTGSPFRQWARGIGEATGDLIWIAESDDFCDRDFLSNLVGAFSDEAVMLAYGKSVFVDQNQSTLPHFFENYVGELECRDQWNGPYTNTSYNEVRCALGLKNTIPNASGVLFRTPKEISLLSDDEWLSMRVAGDWVFYLHILRGGKIAYRPDAINFFRRYEGSTAEATYRKEIFYREVGIANRTVAALYDVPMEVLARCRENYRYFYRIKVGNDDAQFERWYNFDSVLKARESRMGNILIPTMGFSPGGAEILPIRLANEFKRQGYSVLFLNVGFYPFTSGIRKLLRNDIPLANVSDTMLKNVIEEYGIEILNSHQWHFQKLPMAYADMFDDLKVHVAALHGMIEHNEAFETTDEQLLAANENVTTWVYTADKNIVPFKNCGILDEQKFRKLPNGMEPPVVVPVSRSELGIPDDAFVLCCVSRAIPDKGWEECVEAVGIARSISGCDIRLILVGNGPIYDEYSQKPAPDYVYPVGFSKDSIGYYAASDMGIMLSRFKSESFPLTIVDCLFAGKPYIGTNVGEIPNMLTIDDVDVGTVIKLNNWKIPVEDVAQEIADFASNPDRYQLALKAVPAAANRYRIDNVASQYINQFRADMGGDTIGKRKVLQQREL
ncbi:glycoside hydrolase family 99-like domain-containing protein [Ensifer sp. 1H6]|uniref:glycoside hydrolase family 99-like domain-containing protein n=1 Tax=Ensifer sp. 1H6 TaxID=1911585 RepID=UPI0009D4BB0A|nr:glycoside hydrolase family 99-like domain-containing protein [Ensifer sp. 1H6]OMQ42876.1 hypothetical protein BKP54_21620 [Ensifer sp. 1H6]